MNQNESLNGSLQCVRRVLASNDFRRQFPVEPRVGSALGVAEFRCDGAGRSRGAEYHISIDIWTDRITVVAEMRESLQTITLRRQRETWNGMTPESQVTVSQSEIDLPGSSRIDIGMFPSLMVSHSHPDRFVARTDDPQHTLEWIGQTSAEYRR